MISYRGCPAVFLCTCAMLGVAAPGTAAASEQECSLATLQGDYLVTGLAQARLDQRDDPTFARLHVGSWVFDGKGNASLTATENRGGQVSRFADFVATYTMDPARCVATGTGGGTVFEIAVTRDGEEAEAILTSGPEGRVNISARHFQRRSNQGHHACSLATLNGDYLINGPAQARVAEREDPTFPRINLGNWRFDGQGRLVGTFAIQNHGGQIIRQEDNPGTYSVDPDRCILTVTFASAVSWEIFLTPDGREGDGIRIDGSEGQVILATRHIRKN